MNSPIDLRTAYPGAFYLDAKDLASLASYLAKRGLLDSSESILRTERAGESNMNCVVRVRTSQRSFILKQSRPWVEKYPSIAAPWDRVAVEANFYKTVVADSEVAAHLPKLLAFDAVERLMILEDLGSAGDFTFLSSGSDDRKIDCEVAVLTQFLVRLHSAFRDPNLSSSFENSDMRTLNHEHIFVLPLRPENGLELDAITPGLANLANELQGNAVYRETVDKAGGRYLSRSGGSALLHGDFFPGSWLLAEGNVFVIDPEFCFYGPPEWDLGVMLAHLHLAGRSREFISSVDARYAASTRLDRPLASQFAGIEIMRRLIGVAQLPIRYGLERKRELLNLSLRLVLESGSD